MSWARLLKRVFDIDVEHCPNCGGALKIIAAIEDPPVRQPMKPTTRKRPLQHYSWHSQCFLNCVRELSAL